MQQLVLDEEEGVLRINRKKAGRGVTAVHRTTRYGLLCSRLTYGYTP